MLLNMRLKCHILIKSACWPKPLISRQLRILFLSLIYVYIVRCSIQGQNFNLYFWNTTTTNVPRVFWPNRTSCDKLFPFTYALSCVLLSIAKTSDCPFSSKEPWPQRPKLPERPEPRYTKIQIARLVLPISIILYHIWLHQLHNKKS